MQFSTRVLMSIPFAFATIHPFAAAVASERAAEQTHVAPQSVERWGIFELALQGSAEGNPFQDVTLSARFQQGDRTLEAEGFYDGDGMYRVRFSPDTLGKWSYTTHSNRKELDGRSGVFLCMAPKPGNHGPVRVHKTWHFAYADGTPYFQVGTTCYAWIHQDEKLQEQTLATLRTAPFNKMRMCVFPKHYDFNNNEPPYYPFPRQGGKNDFSRFQPEFFRHLERRVADLRDLGIEADLILFHPYDRWGYANMDRQTDDRYLRYVVARLAAYRNVWWSMANEYDLMKDKTMADWDRFFQIVQRHDPHGRLRSVHNCGPWYDHTKSWVTHCSIQGADFAAASKAREKYGKPAVYDECRYEGNIHHGWGNLTAEQMVRHFWLGTIAGCYVGHGETYKDAQDILWWSKGGVLHGESPNRIQWLKDFMAKAPPFHELQPLGTDKNRFILGKPGEYYLVYCVSARPQTLELAGERPYKVDTINPWAMTIAPSGSARPGAFTVTPMRPDTLFRLTPYAAGESPRPEARIQATPTEGVLPLTVSFRAVTTATRLEWDFGDGTRAAGREAEHTYAQPGVHTVTLTASDENAAVAVAHAEVATERETSHPAIRAGFAGDERPALQLHGTAKRGADGTLLLPEGAPWGWVQAGDKPLDDLRGLRSFTISGWLRPASLTVGPGGNRIMFCLNEDKDGIDLVCHADGRLRLSVNEWPDAVKNDSAPGKLVVGKWTFFAVTYDAKQAQENVGWYFSPPVDAPGKADVALDRKTSYNVGPVGTDIGPLTIGNFNQTMRSFGSDRQFRGEIRALQLFGSRVGSRGTMDLKAIQSPLGSELE